MEGKYIFLLAFSGFICSLDSHKYVNKILAKMPQDRIHLSTPIISVKTLEATDGKKPEVVLTTDEGKELVFDRIILACHSDTSLDMLRPGNITEEEERILSEFEWNRNEVILHADEMVCFRFLVLIIVLALTTTCCS